MLVGELKHILAQLPENIEVMVAPCSFTPLDIVNYDGELPTPVSYVVFATERTGMICLFIDTAHLPADLDKKEPQSGRAPRSRASTR